MKYISVNKLVFSKIINYCVSIIVFKNIIINIIIKIYNILFIIFLPVLFLRLLIKSLKLPEYRLRWRERLGLLPLIRLDNVVWIHAVSVGEIMAALPVAQNMQHFLPNSNIIFTCTTPAGSQILANKKITHFYLPFDISFIIKHFLARLKPKLLILMEKEIWPNIIYNCYKKNIPIIVANAQLSNRSLRKYLLISYLIKDLLNKIKYIFAQTRFDSYKFNKVLNNNINIIIMGNTKFDNALYINKKTNIAISRPVWIAASTHPGEEELILQAHKIILTKIPEALLILVPRHKERCLDIVQQIKEFNVTMRSKCEYNAITKNSQIYLVDSIGELILFYSMSQVAFVGGSLVPIGGHNVLEPAALKVPIIVGPYTISCKQIVANMKYANGLLVVHNPKELAAVVIKLLSDPKLCKQMGENANKFLDSQTGASYKIAELAADLIK